MKGSEQVHVVRNQLVKFDGSRHWHGTKEFRGTRYAVVHYSMGTASYEETPALTRAFLTELGYQLRAAAFKEDITPELEELARKAARGEEAGKAQSYGYVGGSPGGISFNAGDQNQMM